MEMETEIDAEMETETETAGAGEMDLERTDPKGGSWAPGGLSACPTTRPVRPSPDWALHSELPSFAPASCALLALQR